MIAETILAGREDLTREQMIPLLQEIQAAEGFLSAEAMLLVAEALETPVSRVYGVATFYNHFSLKPKGEHTCTVCMGTACYVKGAGEILGRLRDELGLSEKKSTTDDGKASVVVARCVGACGIAPAVVFDQEVAGGLGPDAVVSRVRGWIR